MAFIFWRPLLRAVAVALVLTAFSFQLPLEDGVFQRVVKSLVGFYGTTLPEKAYLHLDRSFYSPGETVWFKAYVVEADTHRPDTLSKVLYVDLISAQQRTVAQRTLRLQGGLAHADINLPDTLRPGTYQLRAYTSWMRNAGAAFFFSRPLVVSGGSTAALATSAAFDVRFFPEGGNLIDEVESEIGFKAVDGRGHGVAVQGAVLDGQGRTVASFGSRHLGMGSFRLTPAPGQSYRAVVALPGGGTREVPLPASLPAGYSMRVTETAEDFVVTLRLRGPAGAPPAVPALLLAQVRGRVAFAAQAPVSSTSPVVAKLPKAKFQPGLAHITAFDAQGTAQCERLVFVPNPPGVRLALVADQPSYGPRARVALRLNATDAAGKPVAGEFSVAVGALAPGGAGVPNITSHLLLTSDLAGAVEDPGYYFAEPQNPEVRQALNDLLLTQGWRRFVWKELLAGQLPRREFALEQGLSVTGQVLTAAGQPAAGHPVAYLQTRPAKEAKTETDASGYFRFRGLDGLDTTQVLLFAPRAKNEGEPRIRLLASPAAGSWFPGQPFMSTASQSLTEYLRLAQQQRTLEQRYQLGNKNTVALSNVSVRGRRVAPSDNVSRPYSNANAVVLQVADAVKPGDSRTMMQYLQGRVAGVSVSGSSINIRQASSLNSEGGFKLIDPMYMIDGSIVTPDVFKAYPLGEVQTIEVLNQSAAGHFGIQGYGGVIVAYSRQGKYAAPADPKTAYTAARAGMLSVPVPGYYRAREFYAPRYDAAPATAVPDPRHATLCWLPVVRTDASGQAEFSFFTSDVGGVYQAVAEGLSAQGTPMRGSTTLVVKPASGK